MSELPTITTTIITTGVALAGLQTTILVLLFRWLRQDIKETHFRIDSLEEKVNSRIDSLEEKVNARIDSLAATLNSRIDALRQELRTDIGALHSRIDSLYQALFNHKDPAA